LALRSAAHALGRRALCHRRCRLETMADNRVINVGLVQMSMSADAGENVKKAVARVADAKKAGADVVCLPELYRSPYFCQKEDARLFDLAEPVPGPSTEALGRAAREA